MTETRLWHYTTGENFVQIVTDDAIKPATEHVPKSERPIVWFSLNQWWEPTANKGRRTSDGRIVTATMLEMCELGCGLARIGVDPETAPYDWKTLRELSGMSPAMARGLYNAAIKQGARPGEWRGTFESVPQSQWTAVEVLQDGRWVPFDQAIGMLSDATAASQPD
jgi:hypothetical protein